MEIGDDASAWTMAVHHLVQAHGGDRDLILSRTPTLEQVLFAHFDTHVALEMARLLPPDGHAHHGPLPPGWPEVRPGAYRPFPPLPTGGASITFRFSRTSAHPALTGLPHTGERPGLIGGAGPGHDAIVQAELADWAQVVQQRLRNVAAFHKDRPWVAVRLLREHLRHSVLEPAAAANARWLALASFPSALHGPQARTARGPGPQRRPSPGARRPPLNHRD